MFKSTELSPWNDQAQRPPPGTPGRLQESLTNYPNRPTATMDGILNATLIDDVWKGLQERMSAHFLDNYQKLIGELSKET